MSMSFIWSNKLLFVSPAQTKTSAQGGQCLAQWGDNETDGDLAPATNWGQPIHPNRWNSIRRTISNLWRHRSIHLFKSNSNQSNSIDFRTKIGQTQKNFVRQTVTCWEAGATAVIRQRSALVHPSGGGADFIPSAKKIIWNNALLPDTCVIKPSTRAPHFNVPDTFVPDTGANLFGADLQPINEWGVGSLSTVGKGRGQVCPG